MQKPDDYASILCGVTWFQFALVSVFVALRMYTRHYITRNLSLDDVLILVNLVRPFLAYYNISDPNTTTSVGLGLPIVVTQSRTSVINSAQGYIRKLRHLRIHWRLLWCWQAYR